MTITACTLAVLLLIAGCSTGKTVSMDIRGKSQGDIEKKYPSERYIHRLGTGEAPESASEAARLEIVKYFESKISGESVIREWAQSRTERGKTVEKRMTELTNTIRISASREIPGIEIVGTEKVKKSNSYEAWAVLDKSRYAVFLRDRITKFDNDVDQLLGSSQDDDMKRIRDLTRVMQVLIERKRARQDLSLLNLGVIPEQRNNLLQGVITSLDSLISEEFDVGLVCDGEIDSKVRTGLTKGIVDAGIRLKEYPSFSAANEAGADLIMSVKHDISRSTRTSKISSKEYVFSNVDWVLSVNAMDPETAQVIDTIVQIEKISEMGDEARAHERMVKKVLQAQVPAVSSWVYKLIFKPAEN